MKTRITKLKNLLNKNRLDAVLISSIPNIVYLTGYSGFSKDEREAYLFIVAQPQGLTHKTPGVIGYIITDGRYSEAVALHVPNFTLIERSFKNPLKKIFEDLKKKHRIKKLGIEEDNLTIAEHKLIKKHYDNTYHHSVTPLRTIKDKSEIDAIEKAYNLGDKAFTHVLKKIKKGVSEKELAFELEHFIKKSGGELSFPTIVAFGKNSSVPHHQTSNQSLDFARDKLGQFILLDFGVKLNNYCSDMTRTVFFGKPSDEQKKMYEAVLNAQQKAIKYLSECHPERSEGSRDSSPLAQNDIQAKDVDKIARDYITSQGYPTIPHSLGHGIGIEVHEAPSLSPNSKDVLKEGMVFSVEPGIYVKGFGGVRIEDLVVLEKTGPRLLTTSSSSLTLVG